MGLDQEVCLLSPEVVPHVQSCTGPLMSPGEYAVQHGLGHSAVDAAMFVPLLGAVSMLSFAGTAAWVGTAGRPQAWGHTVPQAASIALSKTLGLSPK